MSLYYKKKEIMEALGLKTNFFQHNPSEFQTARKKAVNLIAVVLKDNGLMLHDSWAKHIQLANEADICGTEGQGLANVWLACTYAVTDSFLGGGKLIPDNNLSSFLFSDKEFREKFKRKIKYQNKKAKAQAVP